jgi:hypothetical protein
MDRVHNLWTGCTVDWTRAHGGCSPECGRPGDTTHRRAPQVVREEERAKGCSFGPHRRAGGNGNGWRREGARGSGGDSCGATKGAEMREGGEQLARCRELEVGACL